MLYLTIIITILLIILIVAGATVIKELSEDNKNLEGLYKSLNKDRYSVLEENIRLSIENLQIQELKEERTTLKQKLWYDRKRRIPELEIQLARADGNKKHFSGRHFKD